MDQPGPPSNRTLSAAEKRRRIFDAARCVIMQKGYDAATMEEIALRAAVGKGTLYNFFSSKEDLFFSLVMDGLERIRELVEAEVKPLVDPWDRFEVGWRMLMVDIFPQMAEQWPLVYQIWGFLVRDPKSRERMFAAWRTLYADREQRMVDTITEGQNSGLFSARVDPSSVALLLMATFDGLLHRAIFDPDRVDPDAAIRAMLRLVRAALEPAGQATN